jgi:transposase-like protein
MSRSLANRFEDDDQKAVSCLRDDLDDLLTCFRHRTEKERKRVRTGNEIERRFREVRLRTPPHRRFSRPTSMARILCAVFTREYRQQGVSSVLALTPTF